MSGNGKRIGYCRVSPLFSVEEQERLLLSYGVDEVLFETGGGLGSDRPVLFELLERLESGDELVVCRLDRLGLSLFSLLKLLRELTVRGVVLTALDVVADFSSPTVSGCLVSLSGCDSPLASLADALLSCELSLRSERQRVSIDSILADPVLRREKYPGRRTIITKSLCESVLRLQAEGMPLSQVARELSISRATVYKILKLKQETKMCFPNFQFGK